MAPSISLSLRDDSSSSTTVVTPTIFAGIGVAGAIFLGLCIYLLLRCVRKRAQSKREKALGAAFFTVRGMVPATEDAPECREVPLESEVVAFRGNQFSRAALNDSVVMPNKAPTYQPIATRDEILSYYANSGPLPLAFRFSAATMSDAASGIDDFPLPPPSPNRSSWRSSIFALGGRRAGSVDVRSSFASSLASGMPLGANKRRVRQLYDPVLPDELVLSLDESLTVLKSFDDGWSIVGREASFIAPPNPFSTKQPRHVELGVDAAAADGLDVGAVPSWTMIKPMAGLRAERPMRTTSLRATVEINAGPAARGECVSWTNFLT